MNEEKECHEDGVVAVGTLGEFARAEEVDAICTCSPGNKLNGSSVLADTCCHWFDCFLPRLHSNPMNQF